MLTASMLKGWTTNSSGILRRPNGKVCSTNPGKNGYLRANVHWKGKNYDALQHRIVFFLRTGTFPKCIDHINGITHDNSEINLRASCPVSNQHNRKEHRNGTGNIAICNKRKTLTYRIVVQGTLKGKRIRKERSAKSYAEAEIKLRDLKEELWHTNV